MTVNESRRESRAAAAARTAGIASASSSQAGAPDRRGFAAHTVGEEHFYGHMLSGALAGTTEHCAMFPLDTIKTRMQTATTGAATSTDIHGCAVDARRIRYQGKWWLHHRRPVARFIQPGGRHARRHPRRHALTRLPRGPLPRRHRRGHRRRARARPLLCHLRTHENIHAIRRRAGTIPFTTPSPERAPQSSATRCKPPWTPSSNVCRCTTPRTRACGTAS